MIPAAFPNIAATGSVDCLLVEVNGDGIHAVISMHFGDDFGPDTRGIKKGINIGPGFVAGCSGPVTAHGGLKRVARCVLHGLFLSHLSFAEWDCTVWDMNLATGVIDCHAIVGVTRVDAVVSVDLRRAVSAPAYSRAIAALCSHAQRCSVLAKHVVRSGTAPYRALRR